uniref:G protein-coupled receptor n=1 Tax=Steinernema glaseri TaxID=37863 RepID=A0A1I7Z8Z2_9BILA
MVVESTANAVITTILPIPHILVNAVVIYLSLKRVRHSTLRTYSLHITIPSLAYSLFSAALVIMRFFNMGQHLEVKSDDSETEFVDYATQFFIYFCGYDYRALAIILVTVTYLNFAKPIFAKKHLRSRNVTIIFLVGHLTAVTFSAITSYSENQVDLIFESGKRIPFNWSDYFEAFGESGTFIIFVSSYVVCTHAIISFQNKQKRMHQSRVGNERSYHLKAQLLAILFYITPPNIFILPSSGCTDLFSAFMPLYTPVYYQLCYAKVYHYEAFLSGRLIVASLTILVAFVDYRNALLMIFRRKKVFRVTLSSVNPDGHHTNQTSSTGRV